MPSTADVVTDLMLPGLTPFKSGKVREVYDLGDRLLVVATDRISAFDAILPTGIPGKGAVLNQLSAWWFARTAHLVPNHLLTTEVGDCHDLARPMTGLLRGRSMIVSKAEALPVECVVRGYLIGSGWKEYCDRGSVSGVPLRKGLQLADCLDDPVFTPSTKAATGHDENISFEEMGRRIGHDLATRLRAASLALYRFAAAYAIARGIIIADTKFEFGLVGGRVILIDEALTPDSSRFWPAAEYRPGISPPSFDKQFVRDYLERIHWNKAPPAPALPADVVARTSEKYRQAFVSLTGTTPDLS